VNQPARHVRRPLEVEQAPDRHLHVVRRPDRSAAQRHRRGRLLLVGGIGSLLAVMFGLVYLHVVLAQRQMELDQMSATTAADVTRYQDLRLQVARLESPQQIISVAEGRLGMRQPKSVTYLSPPPGAPTTPGPGASSTAAPATTAGGTTVAPAGDADWPAVKAALAGRP
jgi:cell division protein FtsL